MTPTPGPSPQEANQPAPSPDAQRERAPRVPFEQVVSITVEHPGSSVVTFSAQARNLSRTGICVSHNAYLYPASPVRVTFMRGRSVLLTVRGTIARCDHAGGSRHDIGIAFTRALTGADVRSLA